MTHRCQSVLLALSVLICPLVCRGGLDCCHAEVAEVSPCCGACDGGHGGAAGHRDSVPDDDSAPQAGGDCICEGAVVEVSQLHDLVVEGWNWLPLTSSRDSIAAVFDFSRPGIARLPLPDDDMNAGRALRCLMMSYLC